MWNASTLSILFSRHKKNTGSYKYRDKYVGRQINASNFKQSILSFIDNGLYYLIGYIPEILKRLGELYRLVSEMTHYRFYASSLLILYDGEAGSSDLSNSRGMDIKSSAKKHKGAILESGLNLDCDISGICVAE